MGNPAVDRAPAVSDVDHQIDPHRKAGRRPAGEPSERATPLSHEHGDFGDEAADRRPQVVRTRGRCALGERALQRAAQVAVEAGPTSLVAHEGVRREEGHRPRLSLLSEPGQGVDNLPRLGGFVRCLRPEQIVDRLRDGGEKVDGDQDNGCLP